MANPPTNSPAGGRRRNQPSVPRDQRPRPRRRWGIVDILVLVVLLVFPALALHKFCTGLGVDAWIGYGFFAALSLVAFFMMLADKRSAQADEWRTPENVLHGLELFGGWPGSFLAQRIFWHKVSKTSYRIVFWFIVILYQFIAIDYLQGWKCLRALGSYL